jgi:hypothetical protein
VVFENKKNEVDGLHATLVRPLPKMKIYISSHPWSIIRYFDQIYNLVINSGLGIPKLLPSKFKFSKTWFQKRPCGYLLISFSSLTQWLLQKRGSWLGKYSYGSLPVTEWSSLTVWYKQSVPLLQLRVAWCRISSVNVRNIPNAIWLKWASWLGAASRPKL